MPQISHRITMMHRAEVGEEKWKPQIFYDSSIHVIVCFPSHFVSAA